MLRLNEKDISIEITETLSFEHHVLPAINEIKEEFKYELEDPENANWVPAQEFVDCIIDDEDKLNILKRIMGDYEVNSSHYDFSIFDEKFLREEVCDWLEAEFDIAWE